MAPLEDLSLMMSCQGIFNTFSFAYRLWFQVLCLYGISVVCISACVSLHLYVFLLVSFGPFPSVWFFCFILLRLGFAVILLSLYLIIFYYYPLEAYSFLIGDGKQVNPNRRRSDEELRGVGGGETIITMCSLKKNLSIR